MDTTESGGRRRRQSRFLSGESLRRVEECTDRPIQQHKKKDEGGKLIGGVRGKDRGSEEMRGWVVD